MMTTTKPSTEPTVTTLYYRYDLRQLPRPLEQTDPLAHARLEAFPDLAGWLGYYGYEKHSSPNEHITYFHSDVCPDEYLALVEVSDASGNFLLLFHLHDDRSLVAWRQEYENYTHRIMKMDGILPSKPRTDNPNMETFHLDRNRVVNLGGWF
jgi:hypothetical protein